ncbi:hypothetical protein KGY64_07940 [Candidatus Bipolaricaulota bacterium]|nr:hypothetical protein [Candidatus Bipolaricaulota bacterium]
MHKELLVVKRQKAKDLYDQGYSINKIADKLVSNWSSVKKWIEMDDVTVDNRGWEKGNLRKYGQEVKDRVIEIRKRLRKEQSYFFGPQVIRANYRKLYPDEKVPTIYFIAKTLREEGMTTGKDNKRTKDGSEYMNYPQRTLDKLGKVVEGIDFVGPRYTEDQSEGVHFLARKYIRPYQYGLTDRIEGQTADEALKVLIEDWKDHPLPEALRLDNDPSFGLYSRYDRHIGRFLKVILNLGITPIYSARSQPWNNGNTEGYNSVFARKFWERLSFSDEEEIDAEIKKFNLEYEKYNDLVGNNIDPEDIEDETLPKDFTLTEKLQNELKDDLVDPAIYWLRIVRNGTEKAKKKDIGTIDILGEEIEVPKPYVNQFTLNKLQLKDDKLAVMVEDDDGKLETIKERELEVENVDFDG